jgi:hypothetical protein
MKAFPVTDGKDTAADQADKGGKNHTRFFHATPPWTG